MFFDYLNPVDNIFPNMFHHAQAVFFIGSELYKHSGDFVFVVVRAVEFPLDVLAAFDDGVVAAGAN